MIPLEEQNRTGRRFKFSLLLKLGIVVGLLYFLTSKGLLSFQDTKKAFSRWDRLGPALLLSALSTFLGTCRWQWLLRAQNIQLPWLRVLQLNYIGYFFNNALPGAVSGDLVKAYYIGKEAPGQRARAFGSILFDRVAGLSALVLVSACALMTGYSSFGGTPLVAAIQSFVIMAAVAVLSFYAYLFLVREHYDPLLKVLRTLERRISKVGSFTRIYEGLRHYHNHRLAVLKVLVLSTLIHLIIGYTFLEFGLALGEESLTLLPVFVVFPLGLLVTAIPVAPAGVGTGHAAYAYLFKLIGSVRGADIFTLFVISNLFFGGIGGLIYLKFRSKDAESPFEEAKTRSLPVA